MQSISIMIFILLLFSSIFYVESRVIEKRHGPTAKGCFSGTFQVHSYPSEPRYPASRLVFFPKPFKKTPAVTYGIYLLDSDHKHNLRARAYTSNVSKYGFLLKLDKFGPPRTQWGIGVSWMACPSD